MAALGTIAMTWMPLSLGGAIGNEAQCPALCHPRWLEMTFIARDLVLYLYAMWPRAGDGARYAGYWLTGRGNILKNGTVEGPTLWARIRDPLGLPS